TAECAHEAGVSLKVAPCPVGEFVKNSTDCGESPVLGDREEDSFADLLPGGGADSDSRDVRVDFETHRKECFAASGSTSGRLGTGSNCAPCGRRFAYPNVMDVIRSLALVELEEFDSQARWFGRPRRALSEPVTERRREPLGGQTEVTRHYRARVIRI